MAHGNQSEDVASKRERIENYISGALERQNVSGTTSLPTIEDGFEFEIPLSLLQLTSLESLTIRNCGARNIYILSQLPNLRSLALGYYDLGLPSLEFLQNLKGLKSLTLISNRDFDASSLTGLIEIERLTVEAGRSGCAQINIGSLSAIAEMPKLKSFSLFNAAATNFEAIGQCLALENCRLSYSNVKDFSWANNLNALKTIWAGETPLHDISGLAGLPRLEELHINNTQVDDISALPKIPKLRKVILSQTPLENVYPLGSCKALDEVDVSNTNVASLEGLFQPRVYDTSSNRIVDGLGRLASSILRGSAEIPNLKRLKKLNCANTPISDISAMNKVVSIDYLDLSGTKVSDISVLCSGPKVVGLNISNTSVTKLGPKASLAHLKNLTAASTQISNLEALAGANLRSLNVEHTDIKDLSPLFGSKDLVGLNIRGSKIDSLEILNWAASNNQIYERTVLSLDFRDTPVSAKSKMMIELAAIAEKSTDQCFLDTKYFLTGTIPNLPVTDRRKDLVEAREAEISKGADPKYLLSYY